MVGGGGCFSAMLRSEMSLIVYTGRRWWEARLGVWTDQGCGLGLEEQQSRTAILDNSCRGINGFQLKLSGECQSGVKGGL
jgi:hypothetical protein